jgi:hypothetical protein
MNCEQRLRASAVCYHRHMISFALALVFAGAGYAGPEAPSSLGAGASPHFAISAQYRPGKAAGTGEVAVTFAPKDPDVKINTTPAPRLKLDEGQKLLAEKTAPRKAGAPDEKYLDLTFPVVFPVAVASPVKGGETVKGALTYYYCSHREGWCRKGTADVEIPLKSR